MSPTRLLLPALLCVLATAAGAADDALQRTINIRLWQDCPSEALREIALHLPPDERFAWYVDPGLNARCWPGTTLEATDTAVAAVLDEWCEKSGLQWSRRDDTVWIWQPADASELAQLQTDLIGGDEEARLAARNRLLAIATPASYRIILRALDTDDDAVRKVARDGVDLMLGIDPADRHNPVRIGFTLLRHPDPAQRSRAGIGQLDTVLPAPWVAIHIAADDPAIAKALAAAVDRHPAYRKDLPFILATALVPLPPATEALTAWASGESDNWMMRYVRSRCKFVVKWLDNTALEEEQDDHARVAELKAEIAELDKERQETNDDQRRERVLRKLRDKVLALGDLAGAASVEVLGELVVEHEHESIREAAAEGLAGQRHPDMVAPLITCFRDDDRVRVRQIAAETLGRCRQPAAIEELRTALNDPKSPITRQLAAQGLAVSRHPAAYDDLVARLEQAKNQRERGVLIQCLALTRAPASLQRLIDLVSDPDEVLPDRLAAAAALSAIPKQEARDALIAVLAGDEAEDLRVRVAEALRPRTRDEVPLFTPILLQAIENYESAEVAVILMQNLQRSAMALPGGAPQKSVIAHAALALVRDQEVDNNLRREALNTFKYTENDDTIITGLEAALKAEKNPVMKRFISVALQKTKN